MKIKLKTKILFFILTFITAAGVTYMVIGGERDLAYTPSPVEWIIGGMEFENLDADDYEVAFGEKPVYLLYVDGKLAEIFDSYDEALALGKSQRNASVAMAGNSRWLWNNFPPFAVFYSEGYYSEHEAFAEAAAVARSHPEAYIVHREENILLWSSSFELPAAYMIPDVPLILQMPELPRGCEVVSLGMMMAHRGVMVDKMDLAGEVDKAPFNIIDGRVHSDPNEGFVGDMYDSSKPGLGVYHKPIFRLLSQYFPETALDITGCEFEDLLYFIQNNQPVWVIINSRYQVLPDSSFEIWYTQDGPIPITYREHSVLVTGYDEDMVYFNDPLNIQSEAGFNDFKEAWEQMGRQAITIKR